MMKQLTGTLQIVLVTGALAATGCGDPDPPVSVGVNNPSGENSNNPIGSPNAQTERCECEYSDEVRVTTCEGEVFCGPQEICGETVLCAQRPNCAAEWASCRRFGEEVESCEGLDDCYEVEHYCGNIFCQLGPVDVSIYGQDCTKPSDCVAVRDGNARDCDACPNAAIGASWLDNYEDVVQACDEACSAATCEQDLVTACVSNTCAVREAQRVLADDFDRTCMADADCVAVFEGEICAECQCPNAAVNVSELDAYQAQFDDACVSDAQCSCAGTTATCVDGTCRGPGGA